MKAGKMDRRIEEGKDGRIGAGGQKDICTEVQKDRIIEGCIIRSIEL